MGGACLAALASGLDAGVSPGADLPVMITALAAFFALPSPSGTRGLPRRAALALGGLIALALPAALAAGSPWTAFLGAPGSSLGLLQLVALGLFSCLAALDADQVMEHVGWMLPGLLVVEGALALAQLVAGQAPAGTFSNSTYLGQAIVVALPFALAYLLDRPRWMTWCAGAATLAALLLVESWVAAAVTAAVLAAWASSKWSEGESVTGRSRSALRAGVAFAAAVVVGTTALAAGASLGSRPAMWKGALEVVADSPVFGAGPDGFRVALAPHATVDLLHGEGFRAESFASLPADPHNIALALLVSLGVVGALGALVLFALGVRGAARRPWGSVDFASGLAVGGYAATTLLAPAPVQTLPLVLVAAAPLVARILSDEGAGAPRDPASRGPLSHAVTRAVVAAAAVCALVVVLHSGLRLWVGPLGEVTDARDAARAQVWADVTGDPFALYVASWRWVATGSLLSDAEAARSALEDIGAAAAAEPGNPFYRLDHARTLEILGHPPEEVLAEYEAALSLFPVWDDAHLELAEYLVFIGRPAAAREHVEFVLEHVPGQWRANEVAAGYYSAVGDEERALFYAEKADSLR